LTSGGYGPNEGSYQADLNQAEDLRARPFLSFPDPQIQNQRNGEEGKNWFLLIRGIENFERSERHFQLQFIVFQLCLRKNRPESAFQEF